MIEIKSIPVGYPAKEANLLKVTILPFSTSATNCGTFYELFSKTTNENEETNFEKLAEGNYYLTEDEYNLWSDDNKIVEDAVLNHLSLERI